jgi:hypothetical protein
VTQPPGPLPSPPDDFASRKLPLTEAKGPLFRLHSRRRDALHFGRAALWRFDDPDATIDHVDGLQDPPLLTKVR